MTAFSEELLKWWNDNARHFPWRDEREPYRILIAEILLHRTRAKNVVPVYLDFISKFPNINALGSASIDEILSVTASLGLKWRWTMLIEAARQIVERFGGEVPLDCGQLLTLPGIGDYLASAVATFAGGQDCELLDTNTVRVICRVIGEECGDSGRRRKAIRNKYSALKGDGNASEFAYSLIDLASLVCLPKNPKCGICPVSKHCITWMSSSPSDSLSTPHRKKDLPSASSPRSDHHTPPS
ncbi:MAG: hypothetical protein ACP5UO_06310 [Thermoplasmata archaeon]